MFASDIEETVRFYREMFGAEVLLDLEMAGAKNVMISIGDGKINLYDQPPKDQGRGLMHHIGIETDDLEALVKHMESKGHRFRNQIKDLGTWKYVMVAGPDNVLIELFQLVSNAHQDERISRISSF
jgi:catechol 2,3-dioxygenase-like lactoylglutathione lyase family enzyme